MLLTALTTLGGAYLAGCGGDEDQAPSPPTTASPPRPTSMPAATPSPVAPSRAVWRQIVPSGALPPPRRDHSLVADDAGDRLWLFGGRASGQALNDLWLYDVQQSAWSRVTVDGQTPDARFGHNAVFDIPGQQMVVFGGQKEGDFFADVWAFDVAGGAWSRIAGEGEGPAARYGAGADIDPADGVIYLSHGFTHDGRFDDTWAFGLSSHQWQEQSPSSGLRPVKRCLMRIAFDPERRRLILFAGQTDGTPFLGDLWQFDTGERQWSELPDVGPSPRNLYSMPRAGDGPLLVLFGGDTEAGVNDELWLYDLQQDVWLQPESQDGAPSARRSHDAVWLSSGSMLLFGGDDGGSEVNDLWELTLL